MKPAPVSSPRNIMVIGAASGAGAPDPGCAEGPDALRRWRVFHDTPLQHVKWDAILRVPRDQQNIPLQAVATLGTRLAAEVEHVLGTGNFPLVVGGDHSCAIGIWSGVHCALAGKGPLGLIWIDAHMDSHTFATTPSVAASWHATGCPARSWRGCAHRDRRASSQAATGACMPDRRAQP